MSLKCPTDLQCLSSCVTCWPNSKTDSPPTGLCPWRWLALPSAKNKKNKITFWDTANTAVSSMKPIAISEIRREVVSGVTKDMPFSSPWCDVYLQFSELATSATCASNNLLIVFLFLWSLSVRVCLPAALSGGYTVFHIHFGTLIKKYTINIRLWLQ